MKQKLILALTLMASGRAMTLAYIHRAGEGGLGDPPAAWLMPLVGDAVVGLTALLVFWLLWKWPIAKTWVIAVAWNAVAAFDAMGAYLVEITAPWPEFFMLEMVGRPMFFAATAMHLFLIFLLTRPVILEHYGIDRRAVVCEA